MTHVLNYLRCSWCGSLGVSNTFIYNFLLPILLAHTMYYMFGGELNLHHSSPNTYIRVILILLEFIIIWQIVGMYRWLKRNKTAIYLTIFTRFLIISYSLIYLGTVTFLNALNVIDFLIGLL